MASSYWTCLLHIPITKMCKRWIFAMLTIFVPPQNQLCHGRCWKSTWIHFVNFEKKLTILFFQQLCQIVLYCNNYWHTYFNKFCHKMTSKYLLDGVFILACETQHAYTCHKQRQLRHIRLNVIIIVSQHFNETAYKVCKQGTTMQCNSNTLY